MARSGNRSGRGGAFGSRGGDHRGSGRHGSRGSGYHRHHNRHHNYWHRGYWIGFGGSPWYGGWYDYPVGWGYNDWGYYDDANPYYIETIAAPVIEYSQPITDSGEADEPALRQFDAARVAFKRGDYTAALQLLDSALVSMPHDSVIHEFRALVFFAQGRYSEATAVLHQVLSVGPGWNWSTLESLYPHVDVYTAQLRALEQHRNENRQSAETRFVLAYHYLSCGHANAAVTELKKLIALRPEDRLSVRLLEQITGESQPITPSAPPTSTTPPIPPLPIETQDTTEEKAAKEKAAAEKPKVEKPTTEQPAEEKSSKEKPAEDEAAEEKPKAPPQQQPEKLDKILGVWKAARENGAAFELTLKKDGTFNWIYTQKDKIRNFSGKYTHGNGILTLVRSDKGPLVGRVQWDGEQSFTFKVADGAQDDPGLTFKK